MLKYAWNNTRQNEIIHGTSIFHAPAYKPYSFGTICQVSMEFNREFAKKQPINLSYRFQLKEKKITHTYV